MIKNTACSADWAFSGSVSLFPATLPPPNQKQHQSNQNGNVRHEWGPSPPPPPPPARNSADFFLSMLEGGHPLFCLKMEASTTKLKEAEEEGAKYNTTTRIRGSILYLGCAVWLFTRSKFNGFNCNTSSARELHSSGNAVIQAEQGENGPGTIQIRRSTTSG